MFTNFGYENFGGNDRVFLFDERNQLIPKQTQTVSVQGICRPLFHKKRRTFVPQEKEFQFLKNN